MEEPQLVEPHIEEEPDVMEKIPDEVVAKKLEKEKKESSYYYWIDRNKKYFQGIEPPVTAPQKIAQEQGSCSPIRNTNGVGSAWNAIGTWEEKNFDPKGVQDHLNGLGIGEGDYSLTNLNITGEHISVVTSKGKKKVGYHLDLKCTVSNSSGKSWEVKAPEFTEYSDLEVSSS